MIRIRMAIKKIRMAKRLIPCITLKLKLGLEPSFFFLKKYRNTSPKSKYLRHSELLLIYKTVKPVLVPSIFRPP